MTPGPGVLVVGHGLILIMQYFSSSFCLHWVLIRQIKFIAMMTKEGFTKIVNFMTPAGAGILMLRCGHASNYMYSEYELYSTLSMYSTLIVIV